MNILVVVVVLAALGLLGVITKSIIAILLGAFGLAMSFLVFCTGALFGILLKILAIIISLAIIGAAILFVPVALIVIIPGIFLAFLFAKKKGYYGSAGAVSKAISRI